MEKEKIGEFLPLSQTSNKTFSSYSCWWYGRHDATMLRDKAFFERYLCLEIQKVDKFRERRLYATQK